MTDLPKRTTVELARDLRIRAAALIGAEWERTATAVMMREAADLLDAATPAPREADREWCEAAAKAEEAAGDPDITVGVGEARPAPQEDVCALCGTGRANVCTACYTSAATPAPREAVTFDVTLQCGDCGHLSKPGDTPHVCGEAQPAPQDKRHTHCDNCGCTWLDDGLNPIGCPYCRPALDLDALARETWDRARRRYIHHTGDGNPDVSTKLAESGDGLAVAIIRAALARVQGESE